MALAAPRCYSGSRPPLKFNVRRRDAELVAPAKPTPREFKLLSDIDDQRGLHFHARFIQVFRSRSNDQPHTHPRPAAVIKDAIAEALVLYYPLAGRIRQGVGGKLAVECTGEGVVFVEAEADQVRLEDIEEEDAIRPPFPCLEELLYDVPGTEGIVNSPLLLIQVTRLTCGAFFFAIRFNHTICDAQGIVQFISAVSEVARGLPISPSHLPVWDRHIFISRNPPRVTFQHPEYSQDAGAATAHHSSSLVHYSFFFTPRQIASLRSHLPPHLQSSCSTFDLLTACLWRCRTRALEPFLHPHHEMRMICVVSARQLSNYYSIPPGFYGNSFAFAVAIAPAGELWRNPVEYAVEEVSRAKKEVSRAEYMQSVADLMVSRGRPHVTMEGMRSCMVTDLRHIKFGEVDFGWGKAVYSGPADVGTVGGISIFYIPFTRRRTNIHNKFEAADDQEKVVEEDDDDDEGILVPFCFPHQAMGKLVAEVEHMISINKSSNGQAEEDRTPNCDNTNALKSKL